MEYLKKLYIPNLWFFSSFHKNFEHLKVENEVICIYTEYSVWNEQKNVTALFVTKNLKIEDNYCIETQGKGNIYLT